MGQVVLDGNVYEVKDGTIRRRNINPRAARFDTGPSGYASFTEGSAERWKGLRGGIGHRYHTSSGTEECYWSEGVDVTHHGGVVLGPKINTAGSFGKTLVDMQDFGDKTYAIGDDLIAEWNDPVWTSRDTNVSDPLDSIVVTDSTDSYLIVSNADSARYTTDGTTWAAITGPKGYMAYFDNKLYSFYGQTLYNSPADNVDGTWDSCNYMNHFGTVYGLFAGRSQKTDEPMLFLHSSEGLWTIDPWVQRAYLYLKLTGHTYAGKAGMFWNSYIFVSSLGGIKKAAGEIVTDIGPDQDDGLPKTYQGYVSDMCPAGDGSWMVFSLHNGSSSDKSSIFKRHGTVGGNQQIYSTSSANTAISCVHYSPSHMYTNGRLWWGEGTHVKYCMMPDFNTDVTEIASYEYVASSGKLVYPIFETDMPAVNKTAIRVRGTTKGCDSNNKFTIYYRTNNNTLDAIGSSWTEFGSFTSSPSPTALEFGDTAGEGEEFKSIQFAVVAARHTTETVTPVLRSLEFDYDVATKRLRGWTFPVTVSEHNATETLNNLHTSQDKDTFLAFYPSGDSTHGTRYWVKIDTLPEDVTWDASRPEGIVQVAVKELIRG